jgi:ferredoxin
MSDEHPLPARVDLDRCVGSGDCARIAPSAFAVSDEGFAVVLQGARTVERGRLEAAVRECPTAAISLTQPTDGR